MENELRFRKRKSEGPSALQAAITSRCTLCQEVDDMSTLHSILLATDFHSACEEAEIEAVARLASAFDSRVTLFHVVEPLPAWPLSPQPNRELATEPLHELADKLVQRGITVSESSLGVGPAADSIVRRAREVNADLILVGAGDHGPERYYHVGPTAAAVMQHATQPVLAVRPGEPEPRFEKILCPVDHSAVSKRGLQNAVQIARVLKGELRILSVVPPVPWAPPAGEMGPVPNASIQHELTWREEFERFLRDMDLGGISWSKEIRKGVAAREIIAAAQDHRSDVIVMGSTGRSGLARMLMGSVTRRVLQRLPCSLLTVKHEDVVEQLFEEDLRHIRLLMAEGHALSEHGAWAGAIAKFRQVLARHPFHLAALESEAAAHDELGESEEAEHCRRRASKLRQESLAYRPSP
jgi:nucleotide-binding universal stress UspA family protein